MTRQKTAVIIGAGPAGLTAAWELLTRTDIKPIVLEADSTYVGGISRTVRHAGNRIDIGGHRFFSKSDRVMEWWLSFLPLEKNAAKSISYQGKSSRLDRPGEADPQKTDDVMLVRSRKSRIYYDGTFFDYPITLSVETLRKLGIYKVIRIGATYVYRRIMPRRPEKSLEDFFINRFGDELYGTFFKTYTEKVWGVPCSELSAEWGAQRVKGLSVSKVVMHAITKMFRRDSLQKKTETSLIEWFLYPKHGPGALWETVARRVQEGGGEIRMGERAIRLCCEQGQITSVVTDDGGGIEHTYPADYVFSTMPINELLKAVDDPKAGAVRSVSDALPFRDFLTVGLLVTRQDSVASDLSDNWIYIHDSDVEVGRMQIFNNWSPFMVKDPEETVWVGLEYFCNAGSPLWGMKDSDLVTLASRELEILGFAKSTMVRDGVVVRQPKAYPAYTGSYDRFAEVRSYLDSIPNIFPIGRNGMHRYNNQDHSMLAAMGAVDSIVAGSDKRVIWEVNAEEEYHEEKK